MNRVSHELATRKTPPFTDLDGYQNFRPMSTKECLLTLAMILLAAAPVILAVTRPLWESPDPNIVALEVQIAKDRAAIAELIRVNEHNRSQIAAMQAAGRR